MNRLFEFSTLLHASIALSNRLPIMIVRSTLSILKFSGRSTVCSNLISVFESCNILSVNIASRILFPELLFEKSGGRLFF